MVIHEGILFSASRMAWSLYDRIVCELERRPQQHRLSLLLQRTGKFQLAEDIGFSRMICLTIRR